MAPETRSTEHRAKRWCFTLNNPTANEVQHVIAFATQEPRLCDYLVFGRELSSTGTPHLQGYVIFTTAHRLRAAKQSLGSDRFHLQVARGTPSQNRTYCTKENDYEEFGECPQVTQGRRTDLERFFDWADDFTSENGRPPTTPEAAATYPAILVKHGRLMDVVRLRAQRSLFHVNPVLREWQQHLKDALDQPPDDRKIKFVIDPEGGLGKSWFVRHYLDIHPQTTQVFRPGKVSDLAHAVKIHCNVFLFDIPRDGLQFLQVQVLEMLKDRVIFSPKYHSQTKFLSSVPHVVVFTNEHPADVGITLTADRYDFVNIAN